MYLQLLPKDPDGMSVPPLPCTRCRVRDTTSLQASSSSRPLFPKRPETLIGNRDGEEAFGSLRESGVVVSPHSWPTLKADYTDTAEHHERFIQESFCRVSIIRAQQDQQLIKMQSQLNEILMQQENQLSELHLRDEQRLQDQPPAEGTSV